MARTPKRMTAPEFEALRPLLGISHERIEAARMALVEGQALQGIANLYGWTRQAVHQSVGVVWDRFEKYHQGRRAERIAGCMLPPGWEQVTLVAPSDMVAQFRAQLAKRGVAVPPAPRAPASARKSRAGGQGKARPA